MKLLYIQQEYACVQNNLRALKNHRLIFLALSKTKNLFEFCLKKMLIIRKIIKLIF